MQANNLRQKTNQRLVPYGRLGAPTMHQFRGKQRMVPPEQKQTQQRENRRERETKGKKNPTLGDSESDRFPNSDMERSKEEQNSVKETSHCPTFRSHD